LKNFTENTRQKPMQLKIYVIGTLLVLTIISSGCLGGGGSGDASDPTATATSTPGTIELDLGRAGNDDTAPEEIKYQMDELPEELRPKVRRAIEKKEPVDLGGASLPDNNRGFFVWYNGRWHPISAR
jgi:hypothetical protein